MVRQLLPATVLLLGLALAHHVFAITISNLEPKRDTSGEIVNAHDGTYRRFGKYWYYHGAQ